MIPTDPTLALLLTEAATDPSAANPCADRLSELGASLRDVLLHFTGTAPDFTDGLPQCVLVAWLRAQERDAFLGIDPHGKHQWESGPEVKLFDVHGSYKKSVKAARRWEMVEEICPDPQTLIDVYTRDPELQELLNDVLRETGPALVIDGQVTFERATLDGDPRVLRAQVRTNAVILRGLKRRVLALFPEVTDDQMLAAPDWIPPEPSTFSARWDTAPRDIRADIAAVTERMSRDLGIPAELMSGNGSYASSVAALRQFERMIGITAPSPASD